MTPDTPEFWAQSAQQFQQSLSDGWSKAFEAFQNMDMGAIAPRLGAAASAPEIHFAPEKLQALQQQYLEEAAKLWTQGFQGKPPVADKRFAAQAWSENPVAAFSAAAYLLNTRTLMGLADAVQTDAKTRARIRFAVEQLTAAAAPSNFMVFNADAQKKAIETKGESVARGLTNLIHDMRQGHVSMTDESIFEVGKNVATTEGAVVFENELFQLIEYKPLTAKVYEKPFLLVPPCINKFYILDLQPENSLIRYAVSQGQRTFVISWRNPDASLANKTWDNYVEDAVIKAIAVTQEISGAKSINTLGFCVGGTLLGCALAVLAARGEKPASSATFLTSFLDFSDTGVLDVFIDESFVNYREKEMGKGGLMKGNDLAAPSAFCARMTWCGTTWSATTSRARRRRRSTCCTGTATAPICRARSTPGTCAIPTWRTGWSSPARRPSAASRSICARSTCRSTSMARAKTTLCPLAAPTPRPRP